MTIVVQTIAVLFEDLSNHLPDSTRAKVIHQRLNLYSMALREQRSVFSTAGWALELVDALIEKLHNRTGIEAVQDNLFELPRTNFIQDNCYEFEPPHLHQSSASMMGAAGNIHNWPTSIA